MIFLLNLFRFCPGSRSPRLDARFDMENSVIFLRPKNPIPKLHVLSWYLSKCNILATETEEFFFGYEKIKRNLSFVVDLRDLIQVWMSETPQPVLSLDSKKMPSISQIVRGESSKISPGPLLC